MSNTSCKHSPVTEPTTLNSLLAEVARCQRLLDAALEALRRYRLSHGDGDG